MNFIYFNIKKIISYIIGNDALVILDGRWKKLSTLFLMFSITAILDFYIITSFDQLITTIKNLKSISLSEIPVSIFIIAIIILIRPVISWILNAYCMFIAQKLLRDVEKDITANFKSRESQINQHFDTEEISNTYITYGRWFVDNLILPFIRSVLEALVVIAILIGLLQNFPILVTIFTLNMLIFIFIYKKVVINIVVHNGKLLAQSTEKLIRVTKQIFTKNNSSEGQRNLDVELETQLNTKMRASFITGAFGQGTKHIIELAAMVSFASTILIASIFFIEFDLVLFTSNFVYVAYRILPSISLLLSFMQSKASAHFSTLRLADAIGR